MKYFFLLLPLLLCAQETCVSTKRLEPFAHYLEHGNYKNLDWSYFDKQPKSRLYTFTKAFEHFEKTGGKIVVELGTSRSFVDGCYVGCNKDDPKYWEPNNPAKWDWGAGAFTYMASHCLSPLSPEIHTVDLIRSHIERCKVMTKPFSHLIKYHVDSSLTFLRKWPSKRKIDLLYLDTGDISPVEPSALLQLKEAKIIVERGLVKPGGYILIDDVKHPVPMKLDGDTTGMGKAKYSIPYLLKHGFELVASEFQFILRKK